MFLFLSDSKTFVSPTGSVFTDEGESTNIFIIMILTGVGVFILLIAIIIVMLFALLLKARHEKQLLLTLQQQRSVVQPSVRTDAVETPMVNDVPEGIQMKANFSYVVCMLQPEPNPSYNIGSNQDRIPCDSSTSEYYYTECQSPSMYVFYIYVFNLI